MAKVVTDNRFYKDLANLLRRVTGKSTKFRPDELTPAYEKAIQDIRENTGGGASPRLQYISVDPARAAHIYEPDEGYDGFSSVRVNGDGDLLPENIKKGVTIFGVEGSAEGGSGETAKTTAIDYSNYASGTFVETLDTGETVTYNLTLDSEGKPTQITSDSGTSVTVEW